MALIGYTRVSTHEQHRHLQQDALVQAGCLKIFTDSISGAKAERKGLAEALNYIRGGNTLVVWCLDRLGRSLKDLIERITDLHNRDGVQTTFIQDLALMYYTHNARLWQLMVHGNRCNPLLSK